MPSCVVTHARPPHEAMHARNLNMTNRSSLLLGTVERSKTLYICTYICMSSIFIRKTNPTTIEDSVFCEFSFQQVKSLFRRGQAHLALGNFAAVTEMLGCCGIVTRHQTSRKILGYPATVVAQIRINMVILCNTAVYHEYCQHYPALMMMLVLSLCPCCMATSCARHSYRCIRIIMEKWRCHCHLPWFCWWAEDGQGIGVLRRAGSSDAKLMNLIMNSVLCRCSRQGQ